MADLKPAKPINLDVLIRVLDKTVLSPSVAGLAVIYTYMFQKQQCSQTSILAYQGMTSSHLLQPFLRTMRHYAAANANGFPKWSSRVWASKSWEHGIRGLLGINRIKWDGQIAVVTGGSQGLGKAIVTLLRKKGARVVVLDMRIPSKAEWEDGVIYYQCDVSDNQRVSELAKQIEQEVGRTTILINNAGFVSGRPLLELSEDEIRKTFNVNTLAQFWTLKAFLPSIIANGGGHIVNVASILGTMGVAGAADYCSSKFAVIGLHEALKGEVETYKTKNRIYLSVVLPAQIRTALFANLKPFSPLAAFLLPMLEPEDIAKRIVCNIEHQRTGEIAMPVLANITWLWRALPSYASDFLRWIAEADDSMSQFHKK
ncbi:NAD(P)-binding protein [Cystobasidium minutum MCA 4210]|uniref:NAD(P)-binding protein n=1 Tax=Cystobasidium minutum MCA 4210 TaxID=1397322 RepID=UPI0034CF6E9E|eukprot:jgi/Rhomi1/179595/fgenesh1_pg.4_\